MTEREGGEGERGRERDYSPLGLRGAALRARLSRRLINDARFEPEGSHLCPRPSAIKKEPKGSSLAE
jgi:hypothetical protein